MSRSVGRAELGARIWHESEGWPEQDRERWRAFFAIDPRFAGPGPWSEPTRRQVAWVYGRYLEHIRAHGMCPSVTVQAVTGQTVTGLDLPGPAVKRSGIRSFAAAALARGCVPRSVARYIQCLSLAVSVLQPAPTGDKEASDFAWLKSLSTALLKEVARMPKKKEGCRLAAEDILALGLREMDRADLSAGCGREIRRYRNGLILALWICLPERLRAFAGIRLRDIAADLSWIDFPEERQKTGRAIRRVIPAVLRAYLKRYLEQIHSIHTRDHDRLWITERGAAAGPKALYGAVRDVTGRGLGVTLSPHRLRDAAARFVVEEMTSEVRLASVILNHRGEQSTAPYIEGANTLKASREAVALIKQSESQAIRS